MTRSLPYIENDPSDFSMLTNPKLKLGDIVIVWDNEDGGEWTQARVVDAQFNRHRKCWQYSAVIAFVDEEEHEDRRSMLQDVTYKEMNMRIKEWYCFHDDELIQSTEKREDYLPGVGRHPGRWYTHEKLVFDHYIVMKKQ